MDSNAYWARRRVSQDCRVLRPSCILALVAEKSHCLLRMHLAADLRGYRMIRHSPKGLSHDCSVWQVTELYSSSPTVHNHVSRQRQTIHNRFIQLAPNRSKSFYSLAAEQSESFHLLPNHSGTIVSVSIKQGCGAYNRKGRSILLLFHENKTLTLYCLIPYLWHKHESRKWQSHVRKCRGITVDSLYLWFWMRWLIGTEHLTE